MKKAFANLVQSLGNWKRHSGFAALWCAIISIGVAYNLSAQGWIVDDNFVFALLPFATASLIAGFLTLWFAQAFTNEKPPLAQFAFFFAALCILTVGITALIFAIHFRLSFPQWSAPLFSFKWLERTFFTMMSASYLFSVVGFRLLMPWGLVALSVVSIGFSRGWFQPSR